MKRKRPGRRHITLSRMRPVRVARAERLVFVDIEMAIVKRHRPILQIAAIAVSRSLQELESFEAKVLIDERKTPAALIRNRHFDAEQWRREGQHPKVVAVEFGRFLGRHATADITATNQRPFLVAQLVAHHAEFDGTFLREWFERLGLFLPASYRVFCTLHRAMWLFHEDPSLARPTDFKLGTLCEYFAIPFPAEKAHDALIDVRATVELYRRMTMLAAARTSQASGLPAGEDMTNGCG